MFQERIEELRSRVDSALDRVLPGTDIAPTRLHEAMRYAVLNGGKRVRPLLVYATGDLTSADADSLTSPAMAIELIHAFSLVHDDLPAMDDDDLRRGKPTCHRQYDEATAILAADALQPLAFRVMADTPGVDDGTRVDLVRLLADACGSLGMTGGQALDIEMEGTTATPAEIETMFRLKTGALIRASVLAAARLSLAPESADYASLAVFAERLGLAFQIKDDILDIEGTTKELGKPAGSDIKLDKSTYPSLVGLEASHARCETLMEEGLEAIAGFGDRAESLRWLADFIVHRRS